MILAVELQTGKASFVWKKMTLFLIVFVNYTNINSTGESVKTRFQNKDFVNKFTSLFHDCFPMNIIKGKDVNKLGSLWLTPGLLKFTNKKNRLYNQSVRSSSESGKLRYKRCKNKLNRLTWTIKRVYLDSRFKEDLKNRPAIDLETDQRS